MGTLEGLFIAPEEEVTNMMGKYVYFGEVLGKHSEVADDMTPEAIELIPASESQIAWLIEVFESKPDPYLDVPSKSLTIMGHNPLHYLSPEEEE